MGVSVVFRKTLFGLFERESKRKPSMFQESLNNGVTPHHHPTCLGTAQKSGVVGCWSSFEPCCAFFGRKEHRTPCWGLDSRPHPRPSDQGFIWPDSQSKVALGPGSAAQCGGPRYGGFPGSPVGSGSAARPVGTGFFVLWVPSSWDLPCLDAEGFRARQADVAPTQPQGSGRDEQ